MGKLKCSQTKRFGTDLAQKPVGTSLPCRNIATLSVTTSQIKFSIASKAIVLSEEGQHCKIEGFGEVESQFRINLCPMLFFLNFTYKASKIWFYKTKNNAYTVMMVPAFGIYGQYAIYFPTS
uniref:Uncharacterized protein n=1 Tax=Cucumis melo TaxID=3656 RepID=A0A9I9EGC8_CUCME